MVILHIATVKDDPANGVYTVVPEHVKAQSKFATVGLLNLTEYAPSGIEHLFIFQNPFSLSTLSAPFKRPDLVIFHQVYDPKFLQISRILRKEKIPYIIVPHGSLTNEAQHTKWLKKKLGNILLFNRFVRKATAIQCLSERELQSSNIKGTKFVGTNGCSAPEKEKNDFRKEKIKFCYIGRLDWHIKGLDILLDALLLFSQKETANQCELYMYGPDYHGRFAHVQQMIDERNLNKFVTLSPPVFGEEKERVLLDADVFIQTSRTEGMPMGILEALSYGLPCLITQGTTLGEFVERYNAGWVASTDAQSVCECITRAIEERVLLDEKSAGAKALIAENFAWESVAENAILAYRKFSKLGDN